LSGGLLALGFCRGDILAPGPCTLQRQCGLRGADLGLRCAEFCSGGIEQRAADRPCLHQFCAPFVILARAGKIGLRFGQSGLRLRYVLRTVAVAALVEFGRRHRDLGLRGIELVLQRCGVELCENGAFGYARAFVEWNCLDAPRDAEAQIDLPDIYIAVQSQRPVVVAADQPEPARCQSRDQ
jgi:hypothetical protein